MRRSLYIAALLCTTALTPTRADAGPLAPFIGAIGAAFTSAATFVSTTFTAFTASLGIGATLSGVIGQTLLSVGLSAIARALAPKPPQPAPVERLVNFAQPVVPMDWVFGECRKGGPYGLTSFQTDRRHYIIILAAHEITSVVAWYVDDVQVEVAGGLVTTEPLTDYVGLRPYLGAPGQTADATLVAAIPEWTSAHNMAGLAYVAAFARRVPDSEFSEVYGNSPQTGPAITPVIRGVKVYDPRIDDTVYSSNAALVWAWVIGNRLGVQVDWDQVAIEADEADEIVTNRDGGSQAKWTLNGTFTDNTDFETLLQQIIVSCDGYIWENTDGTVGFNVGRYIQPTVTLTEDDFYGFELAEKDFGQDPVTEYVAQYVEPDFDYQEATSGTLVFDPDARENRQSVQMYFTTSHNQACRALNRVGRSDRAQFRMTGQIGIIALELLSTRFVNVEVLGQSFVAEIGKIEGTESDDVFTIELSSVLPGDFDFDAATQEPLRPARDQVTNDNDVPPPSGLTGTSVAGPGIEWSWNAQPEELNQQFRFRRVGASDWQPAVEITDGATDIITSGLVDGVDYEAELRNVTAARRSSGWIESGTVRAVANSVAPDPVTGFFATADVSDVDIGWVTANDPNHNATRIYRSETTLFADAVMVHTEFGPPNTAQVYSDTGLSAGNYRYWAASVNISGFEGTLAGPEDATIT